MREAVPLNEEGRRTNQVSIDERNIGSFLPRSSHGGLVRRTEPRVVVIFLQEERRRSDERKHQSVATRLVR
jgi:hypothetical protein